MRKVAAERPGRPQETQRDQQHEHNDADMEENFFKEEQTTVEETKREEEFLDDTNPRQSVTQNVTLIQLLNFAEKMAPDWKKLAAKLGKK